MDADQFIEQNQPISKVRSKLSKYRSDLLKLKNLGYSHEQIRIFLVGKEIIVSVQSISKYFISNLKSSSNLDVENTKPLHTLETISLKLNDPPKSAPPPNIPLRSNSPTDLNKIMGTTFDFKALEKEHKEIENAKKNTQ